MFNLFSAICYDIDEGERDDMRERDVERFLMACDELIGSKFALVDKKIADVLSAIASSKTVYNLIAEYVFSFNFDRAFKIATSNQKVFDLPESEREILPFVFLMLSAIDDGKINILKLIENNFTSGEGGGYPEFLRKVIKPFKDSVVFLLENKPIESEKKPEIKSEITKDIASRLEFLLEDFSRTLEEGKKLSNAEKVDAKTIIHIMTVELGKRNAGAVFGLFLGLSHIVLTDKKLTAALSEISEIINLIK